jgi:hypothetical protein
MISLNLNSLSLGCTSDCKAHKNYHCNAAANNCTPICGDGVLISPELCDNGDIGCENCEARDGFSIICLMLFLLFLLFPQNIDCDFFFVFLIFYRYKCFPGKNKCINICGDLIVVPPELCDNNEEGLLKNSIPN